MNLVRDGEALPASIAVQRWKIAPRSYELSRQGGIASYKLPVLNEFAANELASSLARETRTESFEGESLTGLLLDLRGESYEAAGAVSGPSVTFGTSRLDWSNVVGYIDFGFMSGPGGSPDAARRLATAFMSDGVIFRRQGRQHTANAVIEAGGTNPSGRLPLVILVDAYTIGGAELATAALQDSGRALIIGGSTAGSGTIRRNVSLYNLGVINLPWAQAYAPAGYGIEGRGVMPNICTMRPGLTLDVVLAGLRRGEGMVGEEARSRDIAPDDAKVIAAHRALCPAVAAPGDLAHDLGMAILQDPALYARLIKQGAGS